jgi:hypothetical protein
VAPYAQGFLDRVSPQKHIISLDLSHLEKHVRTPNFSYARRTIRTRYYKGERFELTRINETLVGAPQVISKGNLTTVKIASLEPLTVQVPSSPNVDTSIMSFGIATNIPRLQQSIPQLLHWLPDTGAQLHVISPPHNDDLRIEREIRAQGINLTITVSDLDFAKSYLSIIKQLYEARSSHTQWLVMIDDDTFVPSLPYLVEHLNTRYDASKEVMVAALSDNIRQIQTFGLMPFGGGGIFISVPLAENLVKKEIWEKCMDTELNQGDQVVDNCLNQFSAVRPSWDLGLNQMDFHGDAAGYFESGRRMLTVHHWKTWFDVNVPMAGNVSKACGYECVFQRWQFDDNWVLSNGFSFVEYTKGIGGKEGVNLEKVEPTWEDGKDIYLHHIGPMREIAKKMEKRSLLLKEAVVIPKVGVRQIYVERAEDGEDGKSKEGAMDRVVELLWLS